MFTELLLAEDLSFDEFLVKLEEVGTIRLEEELLSSLLRFLVVLTTLTVFLLLLFLATCIIFLCFATHKYKSFQ